MIKVKILLAFLLTIACALNFSDFGFSQSDRLDEKIYESFKAESILLDSDKLELIRENVKIAILENCELHKSAGKGKMRIASVDIAAQLGLDTKVDESLVPRIENALKEIPCSYVQIVKQAAF